MWTNLHYKKILGWHIWPLWLFRWRSRVFQYKIPGPTVVLSHILGSWREQARIYTWHGDVCKSIWHVSNMVHDKILKKNLIFLHNSSNSVSDQPWSKVIWTNNIIHYTDLSYFAFVNKFTLQKDSWLTYLILCFSRRGQSRKMLTAQLSKNLDAQTTDREMGSSAQASIKILNHGVRTRRNNALVVGFNSADSSLNEEGEYVSTGVQLIGFKFTF